MKINTSPFQNAYRKLPRGFGLWVFDIHTPEGIRQVALTGSYGKVSKTAIQTAKSMHANRIVLGA